MKKVETKGKVGRPRKSPLIPPTSFRGIYSKAEKGGLMEWTYSEVSHFKDIMKTFIATDVEYVEFSFLPEKIVVRGVTNQYSKMTQFSRYLSVMINPADTYSYYNKEKKEYFFKMPISEWPNVLEDMDESCDKFTIIYVGGDKLEVIISNASFRCEITNNLTVLLEKIEESRIHDNSVMHSIKNNLAKFINVKTGDFKGLLGKSSRKNSQNASFIIKGSVCELTFEIVSDKNQKIEFSVAKKETDKTFQIISKTDQMYKINFPCIELHKFLIHMKNQTMELFLTQNSMVARVIKPRLSVSEEGKQEIHSVLTYYVPIIDLDKRSMIDN